MRSLKHMSGCFCRIVPGEDNSGEKKWPEHRPHHSISHGLALTSRAVESQLAQTHSLVLSGFCAMSDLAHVLNHVQTAMRD